MFGAIVAVTGALVAFGGITGRLAAMLAALVDSSALTSSGTADGIPKAIATPYVGPGSVGGKSGQTLQGKMVNGILEQKQPKSGVTIINGKSYGVIG